MQNFVHLILGIIGTILMLSLMIYLWKITLSLALIGLLILLFGEMFMDLGLEMILFGRAIDKFLQIIIEDIKKSLDKK